MKPAPKKNKNGAKAAVSRQAESLYQENILDHYRDPRNAGRLADASFSRRETNYSCGDDVELFVKLDRSGKVSEVRFDGHGCAISQAATSMLTEHIKGLTRRQLLELTDADMLKLLGIAIGPSRLRCATLGFKALRSGLDARKD